MKSSATTQLTLTAVYSQLHLALLNCFMTQTNESSTAAASFASSSSRSTMEPFSANQIHSLARELSSLQAETKSANTAHPLRSRTPETAENRTETEDASSLEESKAMDACVNRLAQAIQVAKATNSLISQPGDLRRIQALLPQNSLLDIVVAHWDPYPSSGR